MVSTLVIYTDGGARGNPGPAAIGVFVVKGDQPVFQLGKYIGETTNNVAEYQAFLHSLDWLTTSLENSLLSDVDKITWRLDSNLVVQQLNQRWKVKDDGLKQLVAIALAGLHKLTLPYQIEHVYREKNTAADKLVNQALDKQLGLSL